MIAKKKGDSAIDPGRQYAHTNEEGMGLLSSPGTRPPHRSSIKDRQGKARQGKAS